MNKKQVRNNFRNAVYRRDKFRCVTCGLQATEQNVQELLDAHHITDRNDIENGGYVVENGISLCKVEKNCHLKAEQFHINGDSEPGFSPAELYKLIRSSAEKAREAAKSLS